MAKIKKPKKKDLLIADLLASLQELVKAWSLVPVSTPIPDVLATREMWDRAREAIARATSK